MPARAQAPAPELLNVVHPLPPQAPPWVAGFQVRWPIRVLGELSKQQAKTVVVSLPTGGWLKADASDLVVQSARGQLLPFAVLSHDPAGATLVQFKRQGDDPWYWVYGVGATSPGPRADAKSDPAFREGISLEVRAGPGEQLGSWAKVRAGLEKSPVLGNALVTEVIEQSNPAGPARSNHFAVSYRGFFQVQKPGTYRFLVNGDDALFLFLDGFKVFERPGPNPPLSQIKLKELEKITGRVDLAPGVHAFEVHQAVGGRPGAAGVCALLWAPPGQPKFSYLSSEAVVHPLYGRVATLERPAGESAGPFVWGLDDTLEVPGLKLFLVRFEAQGPVPDEAPLHWDFGDGTQAKGRSVTHLYFKEGDYAVTLAAPGGLPPFRQRVHVWAEPGESSPLSLGLAVRTLAAMPWQKLEPARIREIFTFLTLCEQPERWPLLDAVARQLLAGKDLDLETRARLTVARVEALTGLGRGADALKLAAGARPAFAPTPAQVVRLQLAEAAVQQYHYKDAAAASRIYKAILDEHSRVEHPNLRLAAIRWGDLFAEAGDLVKAEESYRLAQGLGGDKLPGVKTGEASTRGALLRIAEQKLRAGDIHATRQLLERLELEYPGRRLDGLYCFLRAEADRFAGRYEDALRSYEMIFKLPQWAGYRDRATFGLADTYFRMEELVKARKWLRDLKEGFPKYYEAQKGQQLDKLVAQRQALRRAGPAALFTGFATGFEPDEPAWFGDWKNAAVVRAPGLRGPHAVLLDVLPQPIGAYVYERPLKGLTPGGTYWVELWCRDVVRPWQPPAPMLSIQAQLIGEAAPKPAASGSATLYHNTHGHWHKLGLKLKAPLAHDFLFRLDVQNVAGFFLLDRLSVRPVSDRQLDALLSFHEGTKAP